MPTIPIAPSSIANAGVYQTPTNAIPVPLCTAPKEGVKCVPMQFSFNQKTAWLVNMAQGSPSPPLSQICALYIDATQSTHDVNILFPDTGYQARIELGGSRMIPILTNAMTFYVILDSSGVTSNDIVNVFALNQFVPEFSAHEFENFISYGYGKNFSLVPSFNQSQQFYKQVNNPTPAAKALLINATQWYITAMSISITGNTTDQAIVGYTCYLWQNGNVLFSYDFPMEAIQRVVLPFIMTGLNIISDPVGALYGYIDGAHGVANIDNTVTFNIMGGVLI